MKNKQTEIILRSFINETLIRESTGAAVVGAVRAGAGHLGKPGFAILVGGGVIAVTGAGLNAAFGAVAPDYGGMIASDLAVDGVLVWADAAGMGLLRSRHSMMTTAVGALTLLGSAIAGFTYYNQSTGNLFKGSVLDRKESDGWAALFSLIPLFPAGVLLRRTKLGMAPGAISDIIKKLRLSDLTDHQKQVFLAVHYASVGDLDAAAQIIEKGLGKGSMLGGFRRTRKEVKLALIEVRQTLKSFNNFKTVTVFHDEAHAMGHLADALKKTSGTGHHSLHIPAGGDADVLKNMSIGDVIELDGWIIDGKTGIFAETYEIVPGVDSGFIAVQSRSNRDVFIILDQNEVMTTIDYDEITKRIREIEKQIEGLSKGHVEKLISRIANSGYIKRVYNATLDKLGYMVRRLDRDAFVPNRNVLKHFKANDQIIGMSLENGEGTVHFSKVVGNEIEVWQSGKDLGLEIGFPNSTTDRFKGGWVIAPTARDSTRRGHLRTKFKLTRKVIVSGETGSETYRYYYRAPMHGSIDAGEALNMWESLDAAEPLIFVDVLTRLAGKTTVDLQGSADEVPRTDIDG